VTLNENNVSKFNKLMNQNGSPSSTPPPPPPPRGEAPNNPGGTIRRPPTVPSDFIDNTSAERRHDQLNTGLPDYDHEFEARFHFIPVANLPPPEKWQPVPQTKPSKPVNAN
jgi:hypothetical protein